METNQALCLSTIPSDAYLVLQTHLPWTSFLHFGRGTRSQVSFSIKNDTLHSLLYPNLDDLKLLQMSLDHEVLTLEPKEKRLARTVNMSDVDLKDH